jgi:glutamate synthase (NADPH/NADH) small chain
MQDPEVRIRNFDVVELGYDIEMAQQESRRCINCKNAKCIFNCPVEINIPKFIMEIKEGKFDDAYYTMLATNLFPSITGRVCPQEQQCELVCVLGIKHEPVGIGFLEKFIGDYGRKRGLKPHTEEITPNGKSIAVVGSGPAGMSVASDLAQLGYEVIIYEALHKPGGVLMYGIPSFRLPKDIVQYEINHLQELGVNIYCNTLIGRTITFDELLKKFDAIFIGTGAGLPYFMKIPGEELCGVYSANEYLTRANLMNAKDFPKYSTPIRIGHKVAVVGGGNVAMDGARVAKRLGAKDVDIVYRRTIKEMPARYDEIKHAEEEGIRFNFLTVPVRIIGNENGWIKELELIKMELGEPDESGRRRPIPLKNSNYIDKYDTVIMAIGQGPNPLLPELTPYLKTDKWGRIIVNADNMAVLELDSKIICAGGDIIGDQAGSGGTVIAAMGHGKKAARTIHKYLSDYIDNKQINK